MEVGTINLKRNVEAVSFIYELICKEYAVAAKTRAKLSIYMIAKLYSHNYKFA